MKYNEIEGLFESATIKPTFEYIHIILALYLFGKENKPFIMVAPGTENTKPQTINAEVGRQGF